MVGRFPDPRTCCGSPSRLVVLAAWGGVLAGLVRARQVRAGRRRSAIGLAAAARVDLRRPLLDRRARSCLLLLVAGDDAPGRGSRPSASPWSARSSGGSSARASAASASAHRAELAVVLALAAVPIVLFFYVVDAVGFDEWGGFMLNLFLAVCSIVLCFPLGVLLALGRRSSCRSSAGMCTVYIEIIRGAPLFVLLLLANVALRFFVPADLAPSTATRAIVVFTLFTAAYMAEIVRGGLQSVPRGQYEAAKALGLSPARQTAS